MDIPSWAFASAKVVKIPFVRRPGEPSRINDLGIRMDKPANGKIYELTWVGFSDISAIAKRYVWCTLAGYPSNLLYPLAAFKPLKAQDLEHFTHLLKPTDAEKHLLAEDDMVAALDELNRAWGQS